jgi:hypothetical protein
MSYHFSMGAINKFTNNYEYPKIANKINKYNCPCCEKDVIFKKGLVKQPHFAHYKSDNPCFYYNKPSESQIHKDAKLLMKTLLDNKKNITIHRSCNYCEQRNCGYKEGFEYDIFDDDYNENTKAVIEYRFDYNNSNKSADVAFLENDKIKCIFEICYKNKTKEENRPEPWFEFNAEELINNINSGIIDDDKDITIECIRNYKCVECIEYDKNENQRLILYYEKIRQEKIERNKNLIKEEETKWRESLKNKEEKRIRKEEEDRIRKEEEIINNEKLRTCKCDIMIKDICVCEKPKYVMIKISNNNLFCEKCNKWKCRCKHS